MEKYIGQLTKMKIENVFMAKPYLFFVIDKNLTDGFRSQAQA